MDVQGGPTGGQYSCHLHPAISYMLVKLAGFPVCTGLKTSAQGDIYNSQPPKVHCQAWGQAFCLPYRTVHTEHKTDQAAGCCTPTRTNHTCCAQHNEPVLGSSKMGLLGMGSCQSPLNISARVPVLAANHAAATCNHNLVNVLIAPGPLV